MLEPEKSRSGYLRWKSIKKPYVRVGLYAENINIMFVGLRYVEIAIIGVSVIYERVLGIYTVYTHRHTVVVETRVNIITDNGVVGFRPLRTSSFSYRV